MLPPVLPQVCRGLLVLLRPQAEHRPAVGVQGMGAASAAAESGSGAGPPGLGEPAPATLFSRAPPALQAADPVHSQLRGIVCLYVHLGGHRGARNVGRLVVRWRWQLVLVDMAGRLLEDIWQSAADQQLVSSCYPPVSS